MWQRLWRVINWLCGLDDQSVMDPEEDVYGQRELFRQKYGDYSLERLQELRGSDDYYSNYYFRGVIDGLIMAAETRESVRTRAGVKLVVDNTR